MNLQVFLNAFGGWADWTFRTSLHASVLIGLVWLLQRLFGGALRPRWRYALSLLILLRLMLPIAPSSPLSIFNLQKNIQSGGLPPIPRMSIVAPDDPATVRPALPISPAEPVPIVPGIEKPVLELKRFSWFAALKMFWLAGLIGLLLLAVRRHQQFARWIRDQRRPEDLHLLSTVEDCKALMGVTQPVRIICPVHLGAPAVFGWRRPCLLLPESLLANLSEQELRLVILHELAHIKRRDILLNWIIILVRSWHWFNPLVWLAMRRLRADRELVCDEMVLARLNAEERRAYGNTLIKLLNDFSKIRFCPSLVPAINNRSEIKRRVMMIAQFKPATRLALIGSAALILMVCCFTFTRAADTKREEPKAVKGVSTLEIGTEKQSRSSDTRSIQILQKRLAQQEAELQKAEREVDELRKTLKVSDVEGRGLPDNAEFWRQIERDRIQAYSSFVLYDTLLKHFKTKSKAELRKMIPTASPDTHLNELLSKYYQAENQFSTLVHNFGPENPQMRDIKSLMTNLNAQIEERVDGILSGLEAQAAAHKARAETLERQTEHVRKRDAELMESFRPYFRTKRELETQQRIYETLRLRLLQEQIDGSSVPSPSKAEQP